MNYIIKNINPLDLEPSKGIGINLPFNGNTGLNITYNTKDSIRANILNFLLTGNRERIMNPNFGSDIKNSIFEQINKGNLEQIENIIYNYIKLNFPNVKLEELSINGENNSVNIYFKYSIINTNIEDELQLNFENNG